MPKDWGKTLDYVSCFPQNLFRVLFLPACFTTEQSILEASLFVKYSTRACGITVEYAQHKNKTSRKISIEEQFSFIFQIIDTLEFGLIL